MDFLALNDDVKFIISKHLQSDCKINKNFMTQPDDNLQKILFGEVKEMTLNIDDIRIDLSKDNKNLTMKLNFSKKNYKKIYMGKYFYESYEELKIDAEFMIDAVYKS